MAESEAVLTLGNVPYLNTVPLAAYLPPDVGQREADPGVLADWLRAGTVDAAMPATVFLKRTL